MSLLSDDNTGSCTVFYISKWQMQKKLPRKELQYTKCVLNSWLKCIPIILHFLELHSCCWYYKATKTEKIYIHTAETLTLDLNWNLEHAMLWMTFVWWFRDSFAGCVYSSYSAIEY